MVVEAENERKQNKKLTSHIECSRRLDIDSVPHSFTNDFSCE